MGKSYEIIVLLSFPILKLNRGRMRLWNKFPKLFIIILFAAYAQRQGGLLVLNYCYIFHSKSTNNNSEESSFADRWPEPKSEGLHQECPCAYNTTVQTNG